MKRSAEVLKDTHEAAQLEGDAADKKPKKEHKAQTASAACVEVGENDSVDACSTTIAARLGRCEVCADSDALYCCPKCEVKTCSLRCVQIHKKELDCNGVRDRTKFIPLRKMTKVDFMSDYYFLEECTRYVEDRKNDRIKRFTRYNKVLPTHLYRLRNAAAERGTTLRFLLVNFTRHKQNTTCYDWKQRKIYWRVEWIFANAGGLKYVDERCDEELPLHQLLDKYVNAESAEPVPQKRSLEYYQSVGAFGLKVLLKAEGVKRSRSRFYALDVAKPLKANLSGKTLVEFPCIYVSYEQHPPGCDIIDSDEDVDAETQAHQSNLETLRKQQIAARWKASAAEADDGSEEEDDAVKLKRLLTEKRREERLRKREEFEKAPSNYMFADEQLWEMLSTSSSDNETEEENT